MDHQTPQEIDAFLRQLAPAAEHEAGTVHGMRVARALATVIAACPDPDAAAQLQHLIRCLAEETKSDPASGLPANPGASR
jgi:hypothetical protein